jgi:hypothetical protein
VASDMSAKTQRVTEDVILMLGSTPEFPVLPPSSTLH